MNRFYRPLGGYRPNPWTGFRWGGGHTTFVQNNFYGGGPRPMGFGGIFRFGGFRGGCCHGGCGGGMNWMLGVGMASTLVGGIMNMFGLGGGNSAGTTVIDDRANQNSNTRSSNRTSSETNISITNIYQQLQEINQQLDEMQEILNGGEDDGRVGDSDSDSDIDGDDDIDINNGTGNDNRVGDDDDDSDGDADNDDDNSVGGGGRVNGNNGNQLNLTPGATPVTITSTVHTNDCKVIPGETTWFEVARGMYTGANGAALTKDDIKAIYTALRAQYVDGGHVVNGQVYDKNNNLVDVSNMDLPKGFVKLPDTITVDGKTYNYNPNGTVTPSSYSTNNSNITRAGAFSAVKTSDNKWEPTINGHTYGGGHYDSKNEAINAAKEDIEEIQQENTPITE